MSRIGKTKDVLSRPKLEVAAEAGDKLMKDTPPKVNTAPLSKTKPAQETAKPTVHRTSLSFDSAKTSFGGELDAFMVEIENNTKGLGVKGPKATAILSRFFSDNDEELAKILKNHFRKIRG